MKERGSFAFKFCLKQTNKKPHKKANKGKTSEFQFYWNFRHAVKFNLETLISAGNFRI